MIDGIKKGLVMFCLLGLSSCASINADKNMTKYDLKPSVFAEKQDKPEQKDSVTKTEQSSKEKGGFVRVKSMAELFGNGKEKAKVANSFSDKQTVRFSVDAMKLTEFIHHVFGDILAVNYVIDNNLTGLLTPVTLNFQNMISKKDAFMGAAKVLASHQIGVSTKDKVYYLYPMETQTTGDVSIGIGRNEADLPITQGKVLQIFPMHFGVKIGVERTLRQLSDIAISIDLDQNAIFLQGDRSKVAKVMELARILDLPSNQGKHMGLLTLTYLESSEFSNLITKLLEAEGVINSGNKSVVLVPLNQIGLVAVFASNDAFLQRVKFWHKQLDKPSKVSGKRYFMYEPVNARAGDLGASLQPIFGGETNSATASKGNSSRDTRSALKGSTATASTTASANGEASLVVDERTNTLIFHTTGKRYKQLLPLIKRLDTLPQQVVIEATIAEVTLTDEFKHGVEFAVQNGSFGYSTKDAFNAADIGGLALGWTRSLTDSVSANLIKTNSLVNVLSNPTILARDGVSASMTVGNEIELAGSTTFIPGGNGTERTAVQRTQIGLTLQVRPTINSQGVVIMELTLDIANTLPINDGKTLLKRNIKTEVVAKSGQTIILAGIISENNANANAKVPGFGDLPIFGNLFKNGTEKQDKTELLILITPKIISDHGQWQEIKNKFRKGLDNISF
jgi:general secretion pathway protein D